MVLVLVVLTILAFVLADVLLARRARRLAAEGASLLEEAAAPAAAPRAVPAAAAAETLPEGLHYHRGHTWARATEGVLVAVGLDELAGRVVGKVEGVLPPQVGEVVRQGRAAWTITRRGRSVSLVSPVTGVVEEVNDELHKDPALVNRAPYAEGWVFKARLRRVGEDLKNLYSGSAARKFMDLAKAWVCFSFSPSPSYHELTYQDGGELVEGIGDRLEGEAWERLKRELFLTA